MSKMSNATYSTLIRLNQYSLGFIKKNECVQICDNFCENREEFFRDSNISRSILI